MTQNMTQKNIQNYLISADELLNIIEKFGLSTELSSTGSYHPNTVTNIKISDSTLKRYQSDVEGQEEPIYFLPPDFFDLTTNEVQGLPLCKSWFWILTLNLLPGDVGFDLIKLMI